MAIDTEAIKVHVRGILEALGDDVNIIWNEKKQDNGR